MLRPGSFSAFIGVGAGSLGGELKKLTEAFEKRFLNFSSSPFPGRNGDLLGQLRFAGFAPRYPLHAGQFSFLSAHYVGFLPRED